MSGHFKEVCVCGVVMTQCRCPSPNKTIRVVKPCEHGEKAPKVHHIKKYATTKFRWNSETKKYEKFVAYIMSCPPCQVSTPHLTSFARDRAADSHLKT